MPRKNARLATAGKRQNINKAGLIAVYTSLFGSPPDKITVDELKRRIKTFGSCQCESKACREPFQGYCEFHHDGEPDAIAEAGSPVIWKALTRHCHALITHGPKGTNALIRKTKRAVNKDTQYDQRARRGESSIKSGNKLPTGRKIPSRAKGEYKPRVKDINE